VILKDPQATLYRFRRSATSAPPPNRTSVYVAGSARYMMFELQTSIQKLPGATPIKADMVRHSLVYLDRIAAEKSNDDALRIDIAEGYSELADVLGHPLRSNLGEAAEARGIYASAIGIPQPVVVRDARNSCWE
jgi:hypothetical protein